MNTKYICDLFPFVIFKREILDMDVYRAEVTFFNCNRRDGLFSLDLLFGAVLLVTVLFRFQKAENK